MTRLLVCHNLHTHVEDVILETEEQFIVSYVRGRWPLLHEIPVFEWFIPNLLEPKKYMIQTAIKEG